MEPSPMFLKHLATLGFLNVVDEEGIFQNFPVSTRTELASSTLKVLATNEVKPQTLHTPVHVRVVLETIGQALSLPLRPETVSLIEGVIKLYRRFLLEKLMRPTPIEEDEQFFFKELIKQLSLVFTPRSYIRSGRAPSEPVMAPQTESTLQKHISLCNEVLLVWQEMARKMGQTLMDDTWDLFIRVILGTADSLLKLPEGESSLADEMTPNLLSVLFEIWMLSTTRRDERWNQLMNLMQGWKHRLETIKHWNSMCFATTNRLLGMLYGPENGTDSVTFSTSFGSEKIVHMTLADEYVIFAWHRILHLVGDLEAITKPENYYYAQKGLGVVVGAFTRISASSLGSPDPPDGNTILNIFGGWLFRAIHQYQEGFESGKEEALSSLCSLFSARSQDEFSDFYLASFYQGVEEAFFQHSNALLSVLLRKATLLFVSEFKGNRILVPCFLYAIGNIFLGKTVPSASGMLAGTKTAIVVIRRACVRILLALVCMPNRFRGVKLHSTVPDVPHKTLPKLKTYDDMNDHLPVLLVEGLRTEQDNKNRELLMWTSVIYVLENIQDETKISTFLCKFIPLLLEKVSDRSWTSGVLTCAFTVFSSISNVYSRLPPSRDDYAAGICLAACKFLRACFGGKFVQDLSGEDRLIRAAFQACIDWTILGKWVMARKDCMQSLLDISQIGLNGRLDRQPEQEFPCASDSTRDCAEMLLYHLVNIYGSYPRPTGPSDSCALMKEEDIIVHFDLPSDNTSTMAFNTNGLTVLPFPRSEPGSRLILLTRDPTGRNIWDCSVNHFEQEFVQLPREQSKDDPPLEMPKLISDSFMEELAGKVSTEHTSKIEELTRNCKNHIREELEYLELCDYGHQIDVTVRRPVRSTHDHPKDLTSARLFMTQMGIGRLENCTRFTYLSKEAKKEIKSLDATYARGTCSVGVMYVPSASMDMEEIMRTKKASAAFNEFVEQLGWEISIDEHHGYNGDLVSAYAGPVAPYYSSSDLEMVFCVNTYIAPVNAEFAADVMSKSKIMFAWLEEGDDFHCTCISSKMTASIVIVPCHNGLYRIKIHKDNDMPMFGPLIDNMVVSGRILPHVARLTAINIYNHNMREDIPICARKNLLENAVSKVPPAPNFASFLSSGFVKGADALVL
eukprot:TRINITY_DN6675_c0_g1_i2.p1 TRINITY_DN6675_c0_g1~~TRINITY_DN6675_c0_g1_i2.p1  ORF type:complete len:1132 (+),score=283.51 TRINITY_DN6675_c0_g1_i2:142-3537(+)